MARRKSKGNRVTASFEGKGVNCAYSHVETTRNQMIYTWTG